MKFGVGVEGPSDFQFWHKVLHKHFRGCRFDIRNMKNRDKLIRETPRLLESFQDSHYDGAFILVDRDDDPCVCAVLNLFTEAVRQAARKPSKASRFLHLCVAVQEIESWYLADADAINALVPGCSWQAPPDTGVLTKGHLRNLIKKHQGRGAGFNEIAFAKDIAPKFSPGRARPHSASLRYFWDVLQSRLAS